MKNNHLGATEMSREEMKQFERDRDRDRAGIDDIGNDMDVVCDDCGRLNGAHDRTCPAYEPDYEEHLHEGGKL